MNNSSVLPHPTFLIGSSSVLPHLTFLIGSSSVLPHPTFLIDSSVLPHLTFLADSNNKASGSDGISGQMLLLCDESVILPLKIIFRNILITSTYPDTWKLANVTPNKNFKLYIFSSFVVKFLKKLFLITFTVILIKTHLEPNISRVFAQAIQQQTNSYI